MKITFLGTGTSYGIPVIGCDCGVCRSQDPRNRRLRPAVMIQDADANILIDAPPDLHEQLIRHPIPRLDAIVLTHPHADHIFGLDDVRIFSARQNAPVPIYGDAETLRVVRKNLDYAFEGKPSGYVWDLPRFADHELDGSVQLCGLTVQPVPIMHGRRMILGFRIGQFALLTDCSGIPEESYPLLTGLDMLAIGAVRYDPHPAHFSVDQALAEIEKIKPRRALLTHISHRIDHAACEGALPPNVRLAYDGMEIEVPS